MSIRGVSNDAISTKAKVLIPIAVADSGRAGGPLSQPVAGMNLPLSTKLVGKKLYISGQVSCASSRVSLSRYEEYILRHGAQRARVASEADIILVDTCAFSTEKESMSLDLIEQTEEFAKRDAKVIVTGCLAGISPEKIRDKYRADFFSPKDERQLSYILCLDDEDNRDLTLSDPRGRFMGASHFVGGDWKLRSLATLASVFHRVDRKVSLFGVPFLRHVLAASQAANPHAYAISISQGCLGNCSFCVIPMAKGRTASLPMGSIVERVRDAVESGVERIILTSEDIGAYGKDVGAEFPDLLERILRVDGRYSLFLHFYDPRWLRTQGERLLPMLKSGRIGYLQVPIQSGNDRILNLMRRGYRMEHVLPVIEKLRDSAPSVTLGTQVIAGFPTETDDEHEDTKRVLQAGLFDYVDIFSFSSRPGAATAQLDGHLPEATVRQRSRDLGKAWRRSRYGFGLL